jgi:hypothetical protein
MTAQAKKYVRYFVDYAGLAAFLVTLVITRSAVTATWALVAGAGLALAAGLILEKRLAPMALVTFVLALFFGGLTLFFHDDRFIKMKPTVLYVGFGVFLLAGLARGKNPLRTLMGDAFHLPDPKHDLLGLLQVPRHGDHHLPVLAQPGAADDEAHAGRGRGRAADRAPLDTVHGAPVAKPTQKAFRS